MIETRRLIIREWRPEDAAEAFRMYGDPDVTRFIGGAAVPDPEAMRTRMDWIIARNNRLPEGYGSFAAVSRATGQLIGTAMIKPMPGADGELTDDIEVGWHLAKKNWGQGYATEFGHALLRHGFEVLQIELLHAVVDPPNVASRRVAERLGMNHVGQTTLYYDGDPIEHFQLDRETWQQQQA